MEPKEILSDAEAEALREDAAGAPPGREPEGRVVDVHTDHWERIAADRVPALESIGERMASLLKISSRHLFRQAVEVTSRPARDERWGNYARRLSVPTSLNVLDIRPLNLKGVVCLDPEFLFVLVDFFFGGDGRGNRPEEAGEFTPIEVRLARKFVGDLVRDLREAWKPFIDLDFQLGASEISPIFAAVAGASDPVCVTGFELAVAGRSFQLDIVLPAALIEPIRHLRDAGQANHAQADSQRWRSRLKADVQDARVALRAELARTEITLRDVALARPGDVIQLELPPTLTLYADGTPLLEGTFGTLQGRNAVRITRPANRATVGEKYGRDQDSRPG